MLTQYDMNKKTTIDIFLPLEFKDKLNIANLLSLLDGSINNDTEMDDVIYERCDKVFGNLSIEELYELEAITRQIYRNIIFKDNKLYLLANFNKKISMTNVQLLNLIIRKYISVRTGSDYLLDAIHEDVIKGYIDKLKEIDNDELYEFVKVNSDNVLYLGKDVLIPMLLENNDSVKEKMFKIVTNLIKMFRDKYLGNNPNDMDAYMLPYYIIYNDYVSYRLNKSLDKLSKTEEDKKDK